MVKKDKQIFLDDEEEPKAKKLKEETATSVALKYPPELKCPYGDHIIRDAVLLPCCGHFVCCDSCIRMKISQDGIEGIECPHENCTEIGSLGSIMPFHEIRKKVNDYLNDVKLASQRASNPADVDPFLDSLINDVVNEAKTELAVKTSPIHDIMDSLTKSFDLDKDDEEQQQPSSADEADLKDIPQISPLQDSNISSSLSNGNALPPLSIPPPVASTSATTVTPENSIQIIQPNISISNSNFHIQPPPFSAQLSTNLQRPPPPQLQSQGGYVNDMSYNSQAFIPTK